MFKFSQKRPLVAGFFVAAAVGLFTSSPAHAAGGTWTNASCGNSQATFVQLAPADKEHGFGGTNVAAQLVRGSSGTAGTYVDLAGEGQRTGSADFRNIVLQFRGTSQEDVNVHFCFRTNHGQGPVQTFTKTLAQMASGFRPQPNGWNFAGATSRDFGGFRVSDCTLDRVSFSLPDNGNITIGDTKVQVAARELIPVRTAFAEEDCSVLESCD